MLSLFLALIVVVFYYASIMHDNNFLYEGAPLVSIYAYSIVPSFITLVIYIYKKQILYLCKVNYKKKFLLWDKFLCFLIPIALFSYGFGGFQLNYQKLSLICITLFFILLDVSGNLEKTIWWLRHYYTNHLPEDGEVIFSEIDRMIRNIVVVYVILLLFFLPRVGLYVHLSNLKSSI